MKVGFTFKKHYNENNINNVPWNQVRAIVDDIVLVVRYRTQGGKESYRMMDIDEFKYLKDKGIIIALADD